jgi:hypothetical protein
MNFFSKKSKFLAGLNGSGGPKSILENRIVLYLLFLAAILEIVNLVTKNEIFYLVLFLFAGLSVSMYYKNMVVILFVAIVFIHLVKYGSQVYPDSGIAAYPTPIYEGVENRTSPPPPGVISATNASEKLTTVNSEINQVVSDMNQEYIDKQKLLAELKKTYEEQKLQTAKTGS